jgi:hypothetical protein
MTQIRTLMLLGALTGFAIGIGFGLARQGDSKWIFLKACVAAYLAALLMRWWGRIWIRSIREMHQEKSELEKATQDEVPTTESNS